MAPWLLEARDWNRGVTEEPFDYYRCTDCGLVFLHPVPESLDRYYPDDYHDLPQSRDDVLRGGHHEAFKLDAIGRAGSGKRLLEIGPSYGRFAAMAQDAGFEVHAIEMDPACCAFLQEVIGIRVQSTRNVEAALGSVGRFDVITLWHSLEHLPDAWSVLDALPYHLNEGGLLAVATPNPLSLQFRVFGRRWFHLDAPRHVYLFPPNVLHDRLTSRRMHRVYFSTRDGGAKDCSLIGWIASPRSMIPKWLQRRPWTSAAWRLSRVLVKLEERDLHGAAYTIVFRKE